MIVSQNINLVGFALCGLFYEHDQPIKTYKVNLKLYEVDDANNFSNDLKEMLSIDVDIPTITNIIDPVYQFYLNNSYLISKDKFYFIILTNLSEDAFINTWSGTIYRNKKMTSTHESNTDCNRASILTTFQHFAFIDEGDVLVIDQAAVLLIPVHQ